VTKPLSKVLTGIAGFDEITAGGLPVGRVTLVVGPAGTGKTAFALESLFRGALEHGEPGLFVAFEEGPEQLRTNAVTFTWHPGDDAGGRVGFVDARLPDALMREGDFDLLGLLARLDARVDEIGARRVVFDGLDVLLDLLDDRRAARREVMRLRQWVIDRKMVGLVTAKSDESAASLGATLDFMQFAVDCVVRIRHTIVDRTSHRTIQIAKCRGSWHSSDEHPFTITTSGLVISERSGIQLEHAVSNERVGTGIEQLDHLIGGGYWRGSSILVSGAPGTAKTTLAAVFIRATCERGEPAVFVSFDEASSQIIRNLRSVGVDLGAYVDSGLLSMTSFRTRSSNLELHIDRILRLVDEGRARSLVIDPISGFQHVTGRQIAEEAATRLIDACKFRGVTILSTSLVSSVDALSEHTPIGLSTIADAWIHVAYISQAGERNRTLSIVKARGTAHSNQVRELLLGDGEVRLADVYTAGGEVLVGTLRWEKEREQQRERARAQREAQRRRLTLERELAVVRQQVAALQVEEHGLESDLERLGEERADAREGLMDDQRMVRFLRGGDEDAGGES
jgi:circadian clock protein KaiC